MEILNTMKVHQLQRWEACTARQLEYLITYSIEVQLARMKEEIKKLTWNQLAKRLDENSSFGTTFISLPKNLLNNTEFTNNMVDNLCNTIFQKPPISKNTVRFNRELTTLGTREQKCQSTEPKLYPKPPEINFPR